MTLVCERSLWCPSLERDDITIIFLLEIYSRKAVGMVFRVENSSIQTRTQTRRISILEIIKGTKIDVPVPKTTLMIASES